MQHDRDQTIPFGPFELRPASGELCRDGVPVKLPPQPYKTLLFLVRNTGRLVTRKELQDEIWGADTFVDFDKGLNLCIAQIREALDDDPQAPKYVETLPRRGYRFIGKLESEPIAESAPSAGNVPAPRRSVLFAAIAVLGILTISGIFYFRAVPVPTAQAKAQKSMLLVLPFENLTGDPAQDYFSDGLTEEMISRLGSLRPERLGVIARTTALTYKKTGKDIRQIGDELKVGYVLEGSVRREAGRLRITSQLIRVDDQTHLWAETFDREEKDVLGIQREVAARIASSLSLELLPGSSSSDAASGKFARPAAYDAYLKGRFLITKDTPDDLRRSIPYFDQAIAEDPSFAPAYAAQVEALVLLNDWTGNIANSSPEKAKASALKAVELDPALSESYAALASVQFWLEWNTVEAEANFRRAVDLNPNNPLTRINYGRCLFARGRIDEGSREIEEALRLDPVSLLTTGLAAYAYLNTGRYDRSIELAKRMLELEPKSPAAHECLFRAYISKEDYALAVDIMRKRIILSGAKPAALKRLEGDPKTAIDAELRETYEHIKASYAEGDDIWTMYGVWLAMRFGEKDQAFEWLEKGVKDKSGFILFLDIDPLWEPLRSDPRYHQLKERIHAL